MTAFERQKIATEKRIAKFEKNIAMYSARLDKQLTALQKKGIPLTREDFPIVKDGRWKYSYECNISERAKQLLPMADQFALANNAERIQENTDRLASERSDYEKLLAAHAAKETGQRQTEAMVQALFNVLKTKMDPFRQKWMQNKREYHRNLYQRIQRMLPQARNMYDSTKIKLDSLYRIHGRNNNTPLVKQLESSLQSYARIIGAKAARYDHEQDYMQYMEEELQQEFDMHLLTLAQRCREHDLDSGLLQVHHPRMAERGFDVVLTDGGRRLLDARIIWAAEDSDLVTPHTRYIVTERRNNPGIYPQTGESNNLPVHRFADGITIGMPEWGMQQVRELGRMEKGQYWYGKMEQVPDGPETLRTELRLPMERLDGIVYEGDNGMVRVEKDKELLPFLYIEDVPAEQVRKMMDDTGTEDIKTLKETLALMVLLRDGLPEDGKLPEILEEVMRDVTQQMQDTWGGRQDFRTKPEYKDSIRHYYEQELKDKSMILLKTRGAISVEPFNLRVWWKDTRGESWEAKDMTKAINTDLRKQGVFTVRDGNMTEISVNSMDPEVQVQVMAYVKRSWAMEQWEQIPFRNLEQDHAVTLLLDTGQMVRGYTNAEGLGCRHVFPAELDGKGEPVALYKGNTARQSGTFSTDRDVDFWNNADSTVARVMGMTPGKWDKYRQQFYNVDIRVNATGTGLTIMAGAGGQKLPVKDMERQDAVLMDNWCRKSGRNLTDREELYGYLALKYYGEELKHIMRGNTDRLTDVRIIGKPGRRAVRAKVDGVQQCAVVLDRQDQQYLHAIKGDANTIVPESVKQQLAEKYYTPLMDNERKKGISR